MVDLIKEQLASLAGADKQALLKRWTEFFSSDPPRRLRRDMIIRILSFRLQEQEFGALSIRSTVRLREIARQFERKKNGWACSTIAIKPGTRLVREWQSETHVVHVGQTGYEYRGTRYKSLSEVARLITGTRRSGPLFFGLKDKQTANSKEAA